MSAHRGSFWTTRQVSVDPLTQVDVIPADIKAGGKNPEKSCRKTSYRTQQTEKQEVPSLHYCSQNLRISFVAELPWLGEGRQDSEVKRLMLADQLALHLPRGTNGAGVPLERGRATVRLREELGGADASGLVAGEKDGRLTLAGGWKTRTKELTVTLNACP